MQPNTIPFHTEPRAKTTKHDHLHELNPTSTVLHSLTIWLKACSATNHALDRSVHAGHKAWLVIGHSAAVLPPKSCPYTMHAYTCVVLCKRGRLLHLMSFNGSFTVHRGLCVSACQIDDDVRTYIWPATMIGGFNGPVRTAVTSGRCIALVFKSRS